MSDTIQRIKAVQQAAHGANAAIHSAQTQLASFCFEIFRTSIRLENEKFEVCWDPKKKQILIDGEPLMSAAFHVRRMIASRGALEVIVERALTFCENSLGINS